MLRISESQQKVLRDSALESFVRELGVRLTERTPELAKTLDQARLDGVARRAVHAADTYGFTNRGPVRMYFDLCVTFGSGFVDDPVYPWATKAIGEPDPETQTERAEALFSESLVAADEIYGPQDAYAQAALRALAIWARQPFEFPSTRLDEYAVWQMHSIHPEKADYAGADALGMLFRNARAACGDLGVTTPRPIILTSALQFAFGAGCLNDPLYSWIGATLSQENVPDMAVRFERLERKALTWLDAVMKNQA